MQLDAPQFYMSEILEPVHKVADLIAIEEELGRTHCIEYTDLDVVAATAVFAHVLANRKSHKYVRSGEKDLVKIKNEMYNWNIRVRDMVYNMSDVDMGAMDE